MTHLWIRSEQRNNEKRVGITPEGAEHLIKNGFEITVENCDSRIIPTSSYRKSGCEIAKKNSWVKAPKEAIIFGLKEILDCSAPLHHRHIMFGHAFKGQNSGISLLRRFKNDGGKLYDLEYLLDKFGKRVAAFGYWAGYAGAAVSLMVWLRQKTNVQSASLSHYGDKKELLNELEFTLSTLKKAKPSAIVVGALGRVGLGACDLFNDLGVKVTKWDLLETARGGPFSEILRHDIFLNCILATKKSPILFSKGDLLSARELTVIGDISCDPDSDYNPIPIYDKPTNWSSPSKVLHLDPLLEVMAIDNLPSLLPKESSFDFSSQILPYLKDLNTLKTNVWARAEKIFEEKIRGV